MRLKTKHLMKLFISESFISKNISHQHDSYEAHSHLAAELHTLLSKLLLSNTLQQCCSLSHKALVSSTNIKTQIDQSSRCVPPAPPTHSSCPGLQPVPLALTLAPAEGLDLAVAMMEDLAGVQLS